MHESDLLVIYLNWIHRLIHPHPRVVHKSSEIVSSLLFQVHHEDAKFLMAKIASGLDLTPHLSDRIMIGYEAKKNGSLRGGRALDDLLNHWDIHHLHLGRELREDGFTKRSGVTNALLFAMFRPGAAYIIDVLPHGSWTRQSLAEIAVRNWPGANLFPRLNVQPGSKLTDEDVWRLRRNGYTVPLYIDGAVHMSSSAGVSGAGTSTLAVIRSMHIMRRIDAYISEPASLLRDLASQPDNAPVRKSRKLEFEVAEASLPQSFGLAIRETNSGAAVWIG